MRTGPYPVVYQRGSSSKSVKIDGWLFIGRGSAILRDRDTPTGTELARSKWNVEADQRFLQIKIGWISVKESVLCGGAKKLHQPKEQKHLARGLVRDCYIQCQQQVLQYASHSHHRHLLQTATPTCILHMIVSPLHMAVLCRIVVLRTPGCLISTRSLLRKKASSRQRVPVCCSGA